MLSQFIKKFIQSGELYLRVKVRPDAATTLVKQVLEDENGFILKIDIAKPAVKSKANQELLRFLAEKFGVSKQNIKIISGAGDRLKLVKLVK